MRNKLGAQPVNNGKEVKLMILSTLWSIIAISSTNFENKEIDEQVKEIQKCETKGAIARLEERMLQSYKERKLNIKKGSKVKKVEIKDDNIKVKREKDLEER